MKNNHSWTVKTLSNGIHSALIPFLTPVTIWLTRDNLKGQRDQRDGSADKNSYYPFRG